MKESLTQLQVNRWCKVTIMFCVSWHLVFFLYPYIWDIYYMIWYIYDIQPTWFLSKEIMIKEKTLPTMAVQRYFLWKPCLCMYSGNNDISFTPGSIPGLQKAASHWKGMCPRVQLHFRPAVLGDLIKVFSRVQMSFPRWVTQLTGAPWAVGL